MGGKRDRGGGEAVTSPVTYEMQPHCDRCRWITLTYLGSKIDNFASRVKALEYITAHQEGPGRRAR